MVILFNIAIVVVKIIGVLFFAFFMILTIAMCKISKKKMPPVDNIPNDCFHAKQEKGKR